MYNENKPSKIFFNDLPDEIKNGFLHQIYYNVNRKALYLLRYGKMVKIPNITSLYYYDDDFYVNSDGCLIIIWVDIKTWNIKKKKKKGLRK